jgi:hypothetical protein
MTRNEGVGWAREPKGHRHNKGRTNLVCTGKGARGNWRLWGTHVEADSQDPGQMATEPAR